MLRFILNFLGIRMSGFKRHNSFVIFINKFRNSKYTKNSITYIFSFFIALFLLIGSMNNLTFINNLSKNMYNFLTPVKLFGKTLVEIPITISEYISKNKDLELEIERLKNENDNLNIMLMNSKNLEQEVNELRNFIDLKYSISNYKVTEKILGFDKGIYESFMLISVTHNNIVKEGAVVISSNGLVGIIDNINNNIAKVMHICDPKLYIPVKSESGNRLILSGNGKNQMISKEIYKSFDDFEQPIKEGELLFTSGEGGIFQSGIPVARVKKNTPSNIEAIPLTNLNDINYVWIIEPITTKVSTNPDS